MKRRIGWLEDFNKKLRVNQIGSPYIAGPNIMLVRFKFVSLLEKYSLFTKEHINLCI